MNSPSHKPLLAEATKMQRNASDFADRAGDVSHCDFISDRPLEDCHNAYQKFFPYKEVRVSDKVTSWMKNVCSFYV